MNKIIMLLVGLMMATLGHAAPLFKEGEHYEVVKATATAKPEVLEFFSYFCPHCYYFEPIMADLKKSLPQGIELKRNPVAFLGREMGPELQRAFAVATLLDVEAKFSPVIFKKIQEERQPPQSRADIKALFESIGVAGNEYDGAVDSFAVSGLVAQFDRNTQEMNIRGVPATVINGRYLLKTESVKSTEEYKALVQYLLNKKS